MVAVVSSSGLGLLTKSVGGHVTVPERGEISIVDVTGMRRENAVQIRSYLDGLPDAARKKNIEFGF